MKTTPQILKGMRDFLAPRMRLRRYVIDTLTTVFERYGFEPLETPAVEYAETLEGKYGEEADKLIYKFEDRGERRVGLRYDLTVPLCRVVAMTPDLVRPYKRYQIAPVWRAEKPQKGRYREFWQCDVDIVGSTSILADAEVVKVVYEGLTALGFQSFVIKINHRKVLTGLAMYANVPTDQIAAVYRVIDKMDKIGLQSVRDELSAMGIAADTIDRLLAVCGTRGSNSELLANVQAKLGNIPVGAEGVSELNELVAYLEAIGVPESYYQIDLTMVRGLDYYTGPIFETTVERPRIGSISGGGRYDRLVGMLGGREYPATGVAFGLERIVDVIEELAMAPAAVTAPATKVLVTIFSPELIDPSLALAEQLRSKAINTETYLGADRLGAQLKYADRKGIPYVIIIGPDELAAGVVVLRNMQTKEERRVTASEVVVLLGV
ncbi:MAG: histidine--tRNA ligase [Chloroflexi bacterium]|nr:histidine--tRNA ligase [Chloroflexota bacterium]